MSKALKDGEYRVMRPATWIYSPAVRVTAYREDSETPYILLGAMRPSEDGAIVLTDSEAQDLIDRLKRALSILPTSK